MVEFRLSILKRNDFKVQGQGSGQGQGQSQGQSQGQGMNYCHELYYNSWWKYFTM